MLNKSEILNMPAGREMDKLIAEKVMEWQHIGGNLWSAPNSVATCDVDAIPHYSTDISAAWEVVRKLSNGVFRLELGARNVYVEFRGYLHKGLIVEGDPHDVAPLAICRAALLAVTS